jgi:hypothetical protein
MIRLVPLLATAYVTQAILGLSFGDGFTGSFCKVAFSEANSNMEIALGWHNFLDHLDSLRQARLFCFLRQNVHIIQMPSAVDGDK